MLTHLLMCEHKTAYSSEEEARANTVRNGEDPPTCPSKAPVEDTTPAVDTVSTNFNPLFNVLNDMNQSIKTNSYHELLSKIFFKISLTFQLNMALLCR